MTLAFLGHPISVIRSHRRRLALCIGIDGRIIARSPIRLTDSDILSFAHQKKEWLAEKISQAQTFTPNGYYEGGHVWYLGERRPVVRALSEDGVLIFHESAFYIPKKNISKQLDQVFRVWFRKEALRLLLPRVATAAHRYGVAYGTCTLSAARSRWACCTSLGNLRFSWRLAMTPSAVIDYVIAHELAHRIHLNHSRAFWATVSAWHPTYREDRAWLKNHSFLLAA
jgi:predicted metal-dependent hydrolase